MRRGVLQLYLQLLKLFLCYMAIHASFLFRKWSFCKLLRSSLLVIPADQEITKSSGCCFYLCISANMGFSILGLLAEKLWKLDVEQRWKALYNVTFGLIFRNFLNSTL